PRLVTPARRDPADSARLARLWRGLANLPRPRRSLAALAVAAAAVALFAPGPFWENDLSRLTPVPPADLQRDAQLRAELGAPDVRYMLAIQDVDVESALQRSEQLLPALRELQARGVLAGYDLAARYLPSAALQRARQARLPDADTLRASLEEALDGSPFLPDAFEPFLGDVAAARAAPPLGVDDLAGTPLELAVGGLLVRGEDHATALVSLSGLADPQAVADAVAGTGAQLLDLKQASESLVAQWRLRLLGALAVAALLLAGVVVAALRDRRRVLRVLAPMALTTLLILAVLRGCGVELNLFHLVSLILAAGLGLDYALFFDHAGDDRADQLRTLHAVIVCSLTTALVFGLLALSSIPVLRAIGSTVALGVVGNFVLAVLVARSPAEETRCTDRCRAARASSPWCPTRVRCACGTKCCPGTRAASACAPGTPAIRRIRCARVDACRRWRCASTAPRPWPCMADCWPARKGGAPRRACWWRCTGSNWRLPASMTCPGRWNARRNCWPPARPASSMRSASCMAARSSPAVAPRP